MTAQISDIFQYNEEEYMLIAMDHEIEFQPKDYGLEPYGFTSACWRGFWCEYQINKNGLFLENLSVATLDQKYPPIHGVTPKMKRREPKDRRAFLDPCEKYENINMKINYTGRIVLGTGFIKEYYIHMGFQRAWAYKKVIEIEFENGIVQKVKDHSDFMEEIRVKINQDPGFYTRLREHIPLYINSSFDLSIRNKAWWLDD